MGHISWVMGHISDRSVGHGSIPVTHCLLCWPHPEPSVCIVRPHRPSTRVRPGQPSLALPCRRITRSSTTAYTWRRRPGRPRNSWLEQIRQDSGSSPADLWRRAVIRGHGVTLRPRLAMRWWWWWYVCTLHRVSSCSQAPAMDGCIMRCGVISSCQITLPEDEGTLCVCVCVCVCVC